MHLHMLCVGHQGTTDSAMGVHFELSVCQQAVFGPPCEHVDLLDGLQICHQSIEEVEFYPKMRSPQPMDELGVDHSHAAIDLFVVSSASAYASAHGTFNVSFCDI